MKKLPRKSENAVSDRPKAIWNGITIVGDVAQKIMLETTAPTVSQAGRYIIVNATKLEVSLTVAMAKGVAFRDITSMRLERPDSRSTARYPGKWKVNPHSAMKSVTAR